MEIRLEQASKRYQRDWIFRDLDYVFRTGETYAVLGPNGSGKSTLLKALSGYLSLSKGSIWHVQSEKNIPREEIYSRISLAGPYVELIEEFTLREAIRFHFRFKKPVAGLIEADIPELLQLRKSANKPIQFFSSGMKQRVRLGLSILSDTPVLLLDEPGSNLDRVGNIWWRELLDLYGRERLLVIASNVEDDVRDCRFSLNMTDYKVSL